MTPEHIQALLGVLALLLLVGAVAIGLMVRAIYRLEDDLHDMTVQRNALVVQNEGLIDANADLNVAVEKARKRAALEGRAS